MPGIVGIVSQRPPEECQGLVKSMANIMEHESFYDSGIYSVPEMGIYAGWVAHENSFGSGQPFFNERRDVVLLFSGECFMDPETRTPLSQKRNMSFSRQLAVGWSISTRKKANTFLKS